MKTPLTGDRLRQHFAYAWWKYLLLVVLAALGWSLVFTITAYRPPENKKLEMYIYAYGDSAALDAWLEQTRQRDLPDQETISSVYVYPDESSGLMVLATRLMAGEADLVVLPRQEYNSYCSQGLFIPLEELPGITAFCEAAEINTERAWRREAEATQSHLFGIPVEKLTLLRNSIYADGDYYLTIRVYNGNTENSIRLLALLLSACQPEAAETAGLHALTQYTLPAPEPTP